MRHFGLLLVMAGTMALASGCGTVRHNLTFSPGYAPAKGIKVEVGKIDNKTDQTFDIDISAMLSEALSEKMQKAGLLATSNSGAKLLITASILEYEKGNAFKRWLWPGYGPTVLDVSCTLLENSQEVGKATARRTVVAGGAYTIGAWKSVFSDLASDVVNDLTKQLPR